MAIWLLSISSAVIWFILKDLNPNKNKPQILVPKVSIDHLYPLTDNTHVTFEELYNILSTQSTFKVKKYKDHIIGIGNVFPQINPLIKFFGGKQIELEFKVITLIRSNAYKYINLIETQAYFTGTRPLSELCISPFLNHDILNIIYLIHLELKGNLKQATNEMFHRHILLQENKLK